MTAFAAVSAVRPGADGGYVAELSPRWTIGGKPNGGYLLAILGRACAQQTTHPHVLAASAHYLRSPDPGPVQLTVEMLRQGRSASQLRASMAQDGRACVVALFTLGTLTAGASPYWDAGLPRPSLTPFDQCVRVPGRTPGGIPVPIMEEVDLRLDPDTAGFAAGTPSGRGELRGWLHLPRDEVDAAALLFAVDSFPPATFDIGPSGWVPTLELTAYVRALPEPGPLRVLMRAGAVGEQRVDETCWVWDSAGRLVAQATQLAGVRLG